VSGSGGDREEQSRDRKGKSEQDKSGGEKRKAAREERANREKKRERERERERDVKHRRTATQPDRPVAQPAHVYLALLLRFFEVLIDELSRVFAEAPMIACERF